MPHKPKAIILSSGAATEKLMRVGTNEISASASTGRLVSRVAQRTIFATREFCDGGAAGAEGAAGVSGGGGKSVVMLGGLQPRAPGREYRAGIEVG